MTKKVSLTAVIGNWVLILTLTFTFLACTNKSHKLPHNEATPEEQTQINVELNRLEQEARLAGVDLNLSRVPVLVTSDGTADLEPFAGQCVRSHKGRPLFIQIDRSVLNKPVQDGISPLLRSVLLHEIGHCYFDREHDATVLAEKGSFVSWKTSSGNQALPDLPASLMNPDSNYGLVPKALEGYYLREILTGTRVNTLTELKAQGFNFELVPETTTVCVSVTPGGPVNCKPLREQLPN